MDTCSEYDDDMVRIWWRTHSDTSNLEQKNLTNGKPGKTKGFKAFLLMDIDLLGRGINNTSAYIHTHCTYGGF